MEYIFKDIHSHVLARIDDGSDSMEKSLEILKSMEDSGTKALVLTPHYCVRRGYKPSAEKIRSAFEELKAQCRNSGIDIDLFLGCEIEYSTDIPQLLKSGSLLTMADTKYILTEFPPYINVRDMINAVQTLIQLGFIPIIAHVERYPALKSDFEAVIHLRNIGAKIQVNVDYVTSRLIFTDNFLKALITQRTIDFVAGDVHCNTYTSAQLKRCARIIQKYSSSDYAEDVFYKNAEKILKNTEEKN